MYNNNSNQKKIPMPKLPDEALKNYVKGKDEEKALQFAEEFGKYLQDNGFSTTKLRGFFGEIDTIAFKINRNRIVLLKPKLAYLVGRENRWSREVVENFKKVMEIMIDELLKDSTIEDKHYKNFLNFVKAVVAYHKYNGGK